MSVSFISITSQHQILLVFFIYNLKICNLQSKAKTGKLKTPSYLEVLSLPLTRNLVQIFK